MENTSDSFMPGPLLFCMKIERSVCYKVTDNTAVWEQYIEKLSEYMASTGKRYQSHAATIRRWAGEDAKKTVTPSRNRDYSVKEDETV